VEAGPCVAPPPPARHRFVSPAEGTASQPAAPS
jgi:hypothetical protein